MFKKSRYLLIIFLGLILQDAASQNSQVLYYMNLPQNHLLNPALRPSNSFYLGLPALTGINVNINNNFVNFSDVFMKGKDSIITILHPDYNVDNFIKKLKESNFITPEVNIQLFSLGFNAGKDLYIFLDVTDRVNGNFVLPLDFFKLALKGNEEFLGKTIDLSTLDAKATYYREFGLGFSKNIGSNLRIGAKAKLLFGLADFSIVNRSLGLTVNNDYTYSLNADLSANLSGPVKVHFNSKNQPDSIKIDDKVLKSTEFFLNTQNRGFGLDLGAVYKIADRIQVSASITDLSFIRWKKDVTNLKAESQFFFRGFNISDVIAGTMTIDSLAQIMLDSLKNSFTFTDNYKAYTTYMPFGFSAGASFNLTKSISLGVLSHTIFFGKQIREALTMSANLNLGNAFSTSLSYTAENNRYDNLGAGLAFRAGFFQFYFIADKIPVTWNKIVTNNASIPLPYSWNTINLRLGMNLVFGNKVKRKSDKPMLPEQK